MKNLLILLFFGLVFFSCNNENSEPRIIINKVKIVNVQTGSITYNQTIILKKGIINEILAVDNTFEILETDQVIDGTDKYIIPGLWDMHVHLTDATEIALPMLVANGILGVRDMGGDINRIDSMISKIKNGMLIGPKIFRPGNYLDGEKPGLSYRTTLRKKEDIKLALDTLKLQQADFIKIHNLVPTDLYFELLKKAKKEGMDVVGHIQVGVSPYEASNAEQRSFEHMNTLFEGTFISSFSNQIELLRGIKEFVNSGADSLINTMKENNTWMTPNLLAIKLRAEKGYSNLKPDYRRAYVAESLISQWDIYFPVSSKDSLPEVISARTEYLQLMMKLTLKMQKSEIKLLAGSDLALRDVYPGSGLLDELILLVQAGLTPLEALQTATLNPSVYLDIGDEYGSIETGKKSALVILQDNPLASIENIRNISYVVDGMNIYDNHKIDGILEEVEKRALKY